MSSCPTCLKALFFPVTFPFPGNPLRISPWALSKGSRLSFFPIFDHPPRKELGDIVHVRECVRAPRYFVA